MPVASQTRPFCIHALPLEVFTNIVLIAITDAYDLRVEFPTYRNLRNFALVCKQWRTIIQETPTFWKMISGTEPLPVLDAILFRAKEAKLVVGDSNLTWPSIPLANALRIFKELPRTDTVACSLEVADWPVVEHLFRAEVPELKRFKFHIIHDRRSTNIPLDSLFGGRPPPQLRHLSLVGCKISWDAPIFDNLTTLFLNNQDRPTPRQFSRVLARMSYLQDLHLRKCLPSLDAVVGPFAVNLPLVKRLQIDDDINLCSAFLQRLSCNPKKLLIVADAQNPADTLPIFQQSSRLLCRILSTHPFDQLHLFTTGCDQPTVRFEGKISGGDDPVCLSLSISLRRRTDVERTIDVGVKSLPISHLSSLSCDLRDTMPPSLWRDVISSALPNLEYIMLHFSAVKGFFNALYYDLVDRTENPSKVMTFPRLNRIAAEWPGDPDSDYRPILLDRRRQGVPFTLETLKNRRRG